AGPGHAAPAADRRQHRPARPVRRHPSRRADEVGLEQRRSRHPAGRRPRAADRAMDQALARRPLSPRRAHRAGACRRIPGRTARAAIRAGPQGGKTDMTDDLAQESAARLSTLYRKGKASPVEAMKAVLARTEKVNPQINAFTRVDASEALKAARASARRWKKGE